MHFLAGTLIVLAIIYFMIVSPGFRAFAIFLLAVCGIGLWLIIDNNQKQSARRQQEQAEAYRRATTSIHIDDLALSNVTLSKEAYGGGWTMKGVIANNSTFDLGLIRFAVTIQDCPQQCRTIGEERVTTMNGSGYSSYDRKPLVPAGQTRLFQTYSMKFENLPPATASSWSYKVIEIQAVF
jgi:hypothetical protein